MRLSTRLALAQAAVLASVFLLLGAAQWVLLHHALLGQVDRLLLLRARTLAAAQAPELDPESVLEAQAPEMYAQILDAGGRVVASSGNLRGERLPPVPARGGPATVGDLRMLAWPLPGGRTLVLAEPLGLPLDWLARAATLTGFLGLAALALSTLASVVVLRRGLHPLKQVAATAEAIVQTGDVSRRVVSPGTADVVGQVADSLNALLDALERLRESERRLLADTSHELRNPLTVLRTDLDLLQRELPAESRLELAREAETEAARMAALVDGLLLLSWTESVGVEHEAVRLDRLVAAAVDRHGGLAASRGVTLGCGPLAEASVVGEASRLKQVLANLLVNAINYTPAGGRVEVRLQAVPGGWRVEVEDTGLGIAEEHLHRIFDRFYRVDPVRSRATGGTGLGLAVTRAIVQAHGGRIGVRSRPGVGSVFHVELPAGEAAAGAKPPG